MSKNEKTILAVYIGWAFLHLMFLAIGWNGCCHGEFWPFGNEWVVNGHNEIGEIYDLSEFLLYVGAPAVIFVIYRLLNNKQ